MRQFTCLPLYNDESKGVVWNCAAAAAAGMQSVREHDAAARARPFHFLAICPPNSFIATPSRRHEGENSPKIRKRRVRALGAQVTAPPRNPSRPSAAYRIKSMGACGTVVDVLVRHSAYDRCRQSARKSLVQEANKCSL